MSFSYSDERSHLTKIQVIRPEIQRINTDFYSICTESYFLIKMK